ncbi:MULTISPECIES: FMN-binding protein [Paraclostridium]|nr:MULTISPECIES: FMN-binding protein [Paraclostridium]MBZ6005338.1 FMN-binding protein [Paraclostridium bifermentans]MDU0296431.1 FMN-binding protein [Paraclostridium sp. MRS3W1]
MRSIGVINKSKKNNKKIIIIIFLILTTVVISVIFDMKNLVGKAKELKIKKIDTSYFSHLDDGIYEGEYTINPVSVKVSLEIKESKIRNIKIISHDKGLGGKAEKITADVIDAQSLDVDVVSGATVSSKCILKSIENALIK